MTPFDQLIEQYKNLKLDYDGFLQALRALASDGITADSDLLTSLKKQPIFSENQLAEIQQIIANTSTAEEESTGDETILFQTQAENDATILKSTNEVEDSTEIKNDDEKTILKPSITEDDKTVIQSKAEINEKTVIKPTPPTEDDKTQVEPITQVDDDKTQISPQSVADTFADYQAPPPTEQGTTVLRPGAIINNRFELVQLLGQGGMGSVFKAKDKRKEEANDSNPYVAIKFLNEDFKQHPQSLISLQRESKKSQILAHPNIITVHDFDRDGDTVYMTMELMDGEPLDELLRKHKNVGVGKEKALKILEDISQALAYAHKKQLVHSDFKPGNVFVTKAGVAKVLDFGIARAVQHKGESSGETTVFDAGELGGLTPAYASCEMLEGKEPAPADDMFAVGCVAYELFTGHHPFNKLPANKARDKKLQVEPLKQLERRQAQALLNTLKFDRNQRTADATQFVTEFFQKKQTSKGLWFTLAVTALLLVGIGVKVFLDFQQEQQVQSLISTINQGDDSNIEQSIAQIKTLGNTARETVLLEVREKIITFYSQKALPLAAQSSGQYDFPQALAILGQARDLYPDSAQLKDMIEQLENNRNQLLNTLAGQLNNYLQKGKLLSNAATEDIRDIFALIKRIDPQSALLSDKRLQLAYAREIKTALDRNKLSLAEDLLKKGLSLFSENEDLLALGQQLKSLQTQALEDQQLADLQKQLNESGASISPEMRKKAIVRHKEKLQLLIDNPFNDNMWPNRVQSEVMALNAFAKNTDSAVNKLKNTAASILVSQAKSLRRENQLAEAKVLLENAEKIAPKLSALTREKRALAVAQRKQRSTLATLERSEKINALKRTLQTQAKANDVKNAKNSLAQLVKLAANDSFVKIKGPEAIADAYMRLAAGFAERREFDNALSMTQNGLKIAPNYILLKTTHDQYAAEVALQRLKQDFQNLALSDINSTQKRLDTVRKGFPQDITPIRENLADILLRKIQELATSQPDKAKSLIATAQNLFPENVKIAGLTRRSSKLLASGGQPCKKSYAGHGDRTRATCYDLINGQKAPLMVVIPPIEAGKKAFAISKYEISIADYNYFCTKTGDCKQRTSTDDALPLTKISIGSIEKYLAWLSAKTGAKYRLPTNGEWQHAAHANGQQPKKDFNCRLMLGSKQIKGLNLLNAQSGKQNGWGLSNYIGNAQELVRENNKIHARGGAYTDSFSQCTISLKRRHNGKSDDITGFRIVKDLM